MGKAPVCFLSEKHPHNVGKMAAALIAHGKTLKHPHVSEEVERLRSCSIVSSETPPLEYHHMPREALKCYINNIKKHCNTPRVWGRLYLGTGDLELERNTSSYVWSTETSLTVFETPSHV